MVLLFFSLGCHTMERIKDRTTDAGDSLSLRLTGKARSLHSATAAQTIPSGGIHCSFGTHVQSFMPVGAA